MKHYSQIYNSVRQDCSLTHELLISYRKLCFLNHARPVDAEFHQLVRTWLVCASCQMPVISKSFELQIQVGGGKGSNKVRVLSKVYRLWRRGDLLVSALDFRSGGRWFEPGLCRRVVSLDKKLYSTFVSLHPGV